MLEKTPDFKWLLKEDEPIESVLVNKYFTLEYAKEMLAKGPKGVNLIYLVKWFNLSYSDTTWETASTIRDRDDMRQTKIKDFERFNRSLDNNSRQKMMGFGYAHK